MTEPLEGGTAALFPGYAPHRVEEQHEPMTLFDTGPAPMPGQAELGERELARKQRP